MKQILTLAAACVSLCAGTNLTETARVGSNTAEITNTTTLSNYFNLSSYFQIDTNQLDFPYITTSLPIERRWNEYFPIEFRDERTNVLNINLVTNTVTQWLTIEQEDSLQFLKAKQVGTLQTNQVLIVIAYGKTNEVILKELGREEWPSQKRVVMVPKERGPKLK